MSRTQYESEEDRENERKITAYLLDAWGFELRKLPKSYRADFAAMKGDEFKAIVETKRRYFKHGRFPDIIMSVQKFLYARDLAHFLGVPFIFVVWLDDGVYHASLHENYEVSFKGRTKNTRDSEDIEPVIHIPIEHFKKTKKIL